MKTPLILLILLFNFSAFADAKGALEVCPAGFVVLPHTHLEDIRGFHTMTCKTVISYHEYASCVREPEFRGGSFQVQCDIGRHRGCCYSRFNGNPNADLRLVRCDSIDTRDSWTALLDLFRKDKK